MSASTTINRRAFLKVSALAGGGLSLGFNWLAAMNPESPVSQTAVLNAFLEIDPTGLITILSPNPEIGQGIKTAMPMIVAEELDVTWDQVQVRQAPLDTVNYQNQFAGGSLSVKRGWDAWRTAGAAAREMLKQTAAQQWKVDAASLKTKAGKVWWGDKTLTYGELATAAANMEAPADITFKNPADFTVIGKAQPNVDNPHIVTGKPLFGLDFKREGMLHAVITRRPAFGMKLKSFDASAAKKVTGVKEVIEIDGKVAVIGTSTWATMKGRKALIIEWEPEGTLESTADYDKAFNDALDAEGELKREDGDVEEAFAKAAQVFEAEYQCPFLPHNAMEPMNFFADVRADRVELIGPTQTPGRAQRVASDITGISVDNITVEMTRMGGGFGRRLSADFVDEAVRVSQAIKAPVKVTWSREDDMSWGVYRNAAKYRYRAAVDKSGNMTGFEVIGVAARTRNATRHNNFPASAVPNYRAVSHNIETAVTTGAWRSPIHNFVAVAEQSFLDEIAAKLKKDPLQYRLDLYKQALASPVGKLEYEPSRFIGVLELVAEKANWGKAPAGVYQGIAAYFCHSSYAAEVVEVKLVDGEPQIVRVVAAIDCGIVINPSGALNQVQGGIIDGLGHTLYSQLTLKDGKPEQQNFNRYKLIRIDQVPPKIEVHFVDSDVRPTGLGEPALPPAAAAYANAVYAATGQRWRVAPFLEREQDASAG